MKAANDGPEAANDHLRRIQRGDRAALRALYDAAAPKLFGLALRICAERQLAEEVLQDAFLTVWRRAETFDPARGEAMSWLAAIVRNRALDAIRKQGRRARAATDEEMERLAAIPDPQGARGVSDELEALMICLDKLGAEQRDAILLAYYEGRSREELSHRFDAPVGTVKTWLRRGLDKLRDCMEPLLK